MTIAKSLLYGISALTLATGAAFAGEGAEQLSGPMSDEVYEISPMTDSMALESSGASLDERAQADEYDVYYIYPVEVTESYVIVPSVDTETPQEVAAAVR